MAGLIQATGGNYSARRPGMVCPHDLVWFDEAALAVDAPAWAVAVVAAGEPGVVRRAARHGISLPVGIRGADKRQRHGDQVAAKRVSSHLAPEAIDLDVLARPPWSERGGDVPALAALADIRHRLNDLSIVWGPTGAVGYELATGRAVAHRESDLDLVVRLPECCNDVLAALCETAAAARQTYAIRCDIQLETPAGGVALADWAGEAGQMMVKSDTGPYLTANPWAVAA